MSDQIAFGTDDFAQNPEPRCPCVLLLDTSGSMAGQPIAALNAGIQTFQDELLSDSSRRSGLNWPPSPLARFR
jgi:hypothetical protein